MIFSGDNETLERVNNYLMSGKIMRDESLRHASEPCEPLDNDVFNQPVCNVESTGASLSLSSSISMVYFYCSRLPSDGFAVNSWMLLSLLYLLTVGDGKMAGSGWSVNWPNHVLS